MRDTGFEQGANVAANLFDLKWTDNPVNVEGGEQANGADGKLRAGVGCVVANKADFQAAATQVDDATRLSFRAHRRNDRFAA